MWCGAPERTAGGPARAGGTLLPVGPGSETPVRRCRSVRPWLGTGTDAPRRAGGRSRRGGFMNKKLYLLGAVLGTAPALLPVTCSPWAPGAQKREEGPRGGVSRRVERPLGGNGAEALPPPVVPAGRE